MPVLSNRVKTAVASAPGTAASMSLGTPFPGYQSVTASGVTDQQVVRYLIEDQSNFEIGSPSSSLCSEALVLKASFLITWAKNVPNIFKKMTHSTNPSLLHDLTEAHWKIFQV